MKWIVGIDLGTTHTVVAASRADADAIEVVRIPQRTTASEAEARALLPSFLYAPLEGETSFDAFDIAPWIAGDYARWRGGEVPGRAVASAKSWLCHAAVDRLAPILPWGVDDESVPRISPVDASARYLAHVRKAWDASHPDAPLAEQEVVLTVPASFDEAARELTLEAAQRAGLTVRLLEEPQAAFYDYMQRAGAAGLAPLVASGDALVLVCDVGGGTTDLSLIRVARSETAPFEVTRVAVGRHLLLGGDNMDLALAHACEARFGTKLDASRFGQLVLACRGAKEALLTEGGPDDVGVSVAGAGARLVGGTLSTRITRAEAEALVLDGFFPRAPRDAQPQRARGGLVAFGLPYERDVAITRHVAAFFARHAQERAPAAILLNGGVFHATRIVERLAESIDAWRGDERDAGERDVPKVAILPHADPDLAVARGAVAYALARRGRGVRIASGAARGYYVEVAAPAEGEARRAVCVVPRGAKEGVPQIAAERVLGLVVGRPARFELFASDDARGHRPGDLVTIDDEHFDRLPPIAATFGDEARRSRDSVRAPEAVRVVLEGELTAIGTLDLACVEVEPQNAPGRRFRLAFALRGEAPPVTSIPPPSGAFSPRKLDEAREAIDRVFGKAKGDTGRAVKDLVRDLEKTLGERATWTTGVARTLYDALWTGYGSRRRSADHERVFWQLAGYCLRPGFGDPLDASRVAALASLAPQKLAFPDQARGWQQFWIAWRRVAAGLDEAAQTSLRDMVDPFVASSEHLTAKKMKRPKSPAQAQAEMIEMASSLERVSASRRGELGGWLVETTWTDRDPRLWSAIARIGSRTPAYASVDRVVAPATVERWLDQLLREKWDTIPTAAEAAMRMARMTGDRARDISERVRKDLLRRFKTIGARDEWVRAITEHVEEKEEDRVAFFGEAMPVGLRLI